MAVLLLGVVTLLTLRLHREGIGEVLTRFEEHQTALAQHLSNQIRLFTQARSRELRTLASFPSLQSGDAQRARARIQVFARQIEGVYVRGISLCNESTALVYSTDPAPPSLREAENKVLAWAKDPKNKDQFLLVPVFLEPESLTLVLGTPLHQDIPGSPEGRFRGAVMFTVDMKAFLAHQLDSFGRGSHLDQVWIMSNDGTLLFQSKHPEKQASMVFRNIRQRNESCDACHFSFTYAEEILKKKQGALQYRLAGHPRKIAAFAPMELEEVSWVVVMSAPYDEVTGYVSKSLRRHLILLGVVVLGLLIGAALVVRSERMKIRAEGEVTRWQESVAERRKTEQALQLEKDKLKAILDAMRDGVYIVDQQNGIQYVNPVIERDFGPVNGRKCHEYFHGQPETCAWCNNKEVFSGKTVQWEWHFSRTGKTYELTDTPILGQDGTLCKMEIFHDITERKRAEDALRESERQLRDLSSQLMTAQETERKRISRELHDELGQALTAMKLRLSFIEKNLSVKDPAALKQECRYGIDYIDQVIEDVRRLSRDLSPSILEDFGLYAAIRWLVNNFVKNYNVKVNLEMIDIDILIPRYDHVLVYRIVQEALTNIGKHSQARNASVTSSTDGITVLISIEDDGIGFDPNKVVSGEPGEKGLGLATMKGRAGMLGGALGVRSQEGRGTRITLTIPIKRGESL